MEPWKGLLWALLLATAWLGGLGAVRLLASREVGSAEEARGQRRLAMLALGLCALCAVGVITLMATEAWR